MKKCLIIGKPNVGKTLFMLNFAEYLGYKDIVMKCNHNSGKVETEKYTIFEAKKYHSSNMPFKTTSLQSIEMEIPVLKGKKVMEIIDSSGLIDGVHNNISIRRAMAQTLTAINECDIILHIIDTSIINNNSLVSSLSKLDYQLSQFGLLKEGYVILANKIDLLERRTPIIQLQKEFLDHYVIPISALTMQGFSEVKTYVSRRL